MKTNLIRGHIIMFLPLLLLLTSFAGNALAQFSVITSGVPDTGPYSPSSCNVLNNGVFTNSSGSIYVVTYDDGAQNNGGNPIRFAVVDPCSSSTYYGGIYGIPTGSVNYYNPDIIVGGDQNTGAIWIGIVYTAETSGHKQIRFEEWTVTGQCTSITASNCTNHGIKLAGTATSDADSAHIDLENNYNSIGVYDAKKFMVCWQDKACQANGDWGTMAAAGDLSQQATACNLGNITMSGTCVNKNTGAGKFDTWSSDVAISHDANGNGLFTYINATTGYLDTTRWNIAASANPSWSFGDIDNSSGNVISQPRIDYYDQAQSGIYDWAVAYQFDNGTTTDILQTNNIFSNENITSYYTNAGSGTGDNSNVSPVVTAGPIGTYFTAAYGNPTIDTAFVQVIDQSTGKVTTASGDPLYYQASYFDHGGQGPVAISNDYAVVSSALVPTQSYVCWFNPNNTAIYCKTATSATPAYKAMPTSVYDRNLQNITSFRLYPNPSSDKMYVSVGDKIAEEYTITDMAGRQVGGGSIGSSSGQIDIHSLPSGIYLLHIENKDGSKCNTRFEKK